MKEKVSKSRTIRFVEKMKTKGLFIPGNCCYCKKILCRRAIKRRHHHQSHIKLPTLYLKVKYSFVPHSKCIQRNVASIKTTLSQYGKPSQGCYSSFNVFVCMNWSYSATHGFNVASKSIYPPFIADEQCDDGTVIWIFMTVQPLREFNIITMQNPPQGGGCKQMMWNYI